MWAIQPGQAHGKQTLPGCHHLLEGIVYSHPIILVARFYLKMESPPLEPVIPWNVDMTLSLHNHLPRPKTINGSLWTVLQPFDRKPPLAAPRQIQNP